MYIFVDETHIKAEKAKVRAAKKSRWWQQKCANGRCYYCENFFKFKDLTMDHIVPLARGGETKPGNVVPSCRNCNKSKGVDTPIDIIFNQKTDL